MSVAKPQGESLRVGGHPSTLVGVGGWAYLPVKRMSKLQVCSRLYDFVELNSSFYKLPPLSEARKWRKSVPDEFEFTVRANRELTHVGHLEPTEENFEKFGRVLDVCGELRAKVLHLQFPPSFDVTNQVLSQWNDFFKLAPKLRGDLHIAFEIRNKESISKKQVRSFLEEHDFIPTSDASRSERLEASKDSGILYSRVFGQGYHVRWSFDSEELKTISERVQKTPAKRTYVTFHNLTMYEDASRMRNLLREGAEGIKPAVVGIESFSRTLTTVKVRYPATKRALVNALSWKTFDLQLGKKKHVGEILEQLPERKFNSPEEVVESLPSLGWY